MRIMYISNKFVLACYYMFTKVWPAGRAVIANKAAIDSAGALAVDA